MLNPFSIKIQLNSILSHEILNEQTKLCQQHDRCGQNPYECYGMNFCRISITARGMLVNALVTGVGDMDPSEKMEKY